MYHHQVFQQTGYDQTCDWWSLGVIMFEMLIGYPPFCSETPRETYSKILRWREYLVFPPEVAVTAAAAATVRRFMADVGERVADLREVQSMPWFRGVDWDHVRDRPAAIPLQVREMGFQIS